ncbi:hypothetical protein KC342_g99 [Hortaea werneckii]|nr:hypothetical protein KC342_g99 [Hortaea werneckii]
MTHFRGCRGAGIFGSLSVAFVGKQGMKSCVSIPVWAKNIQQHDFATIGMPHKDYSRKRGPTPWTGRILASFGATVREIFSGAGHKASCDIQKRPVGTRRRDWHAIRLRFFTLPISRQELISAMHRCEMQHHFMLELLHALLKLLVLRTTLLEPDFMCIGIVLT